MCVRVPLYVSAYCYMYVLLLSSREGAFSQEREWQLGGEAEEQELQQVLCTTTYVSTYCRGGAAAGTIYYYMCVLILWRSRSSSRCYILLYVCRRTTIYRVPQYYYKCVLILWRSRSCSRCYTLLYVCPRATIYASSYCYISSGRAARQRHRYMQRMNRAVIEP